MIKWFTTGPLHDPVTFMKLIMMGCKLHSGASKTKLLLPVESVFPLFYHFAQTNLAFAGSCEVVPFMVYLSNKSDAVQPPPPPPPWFHPVIAASVFCPK